MDNATTARRALASIDRLRYDGDGTYHEFRSIIWSARYSGLSLSEVQTWASSSNPRIGRTAADIENLWSKYNAARSHTTGTLVHIARKHNPDFGVREDMVTCTVCGIRQHDRRWATCFDCKPTPMPVTASVIADLDALMTPSAPDVPDSSRVEKSVYDSPITTYGELDAWADSFAEEQLAKYGGDVEPIQECLTCGEEIYAVNGDMYCGEHSDYRQPEYGVPTVRFYRRLIIPKSSDPNQDVRVEQVAAWR